MDHGTNLDGPDRYEASAHAQSHETQCTVWAKTHNIDRLVKIVDGSMAAEDGRHSSSSPELFDADNPEKEASVVFSGILTKGQRRTIAQADDFAMSRAMTESGLLDYNVEFNLFANIRQAMRTYSIADLSIRHLMEITMMMVEKLGKETASDE